MKNPQDRYRQLTMKRLDSCVFLKGSANKMFKRIAENRARWTLALCQRHDAWV